MSAGLTSEEQAILNLLRATYDRPIYRKQNRAEYLVLAIVDRLRAQLAHANAKRDHAEKPDVANKLSTLLRRAAKIAKGGDAGN